MGRRVNSTASHGNFKTFIGQGVPASPPAVRTTIGGSIQLGRGPVVPGAFHELTPSTTVAVPSNRPLPPKGGIRVVRGQGK